MQLSGSLLTESRGGGGWLRGSFCYWANSKRKAQITGEGKKKGSIKKFRWSSTPPLLCVLLPNSCGFWVALWETKADFWEEPMLVLVMVYEYLWRGPLQGCLAPPHSFIVWQILSQFQAHSQVLRKECLGLSNKVATSFLQGDMSPPFHGQECLLTQFEKWTVLNRKSHCKGHWKVC